MRSSSWDSESSATVRGGVGVSPGAAASDAAAVGGVALDGGTVGVQAQPYATARGRRRAVSCSGGLPARLPCGPAAAPFSAPRGACETRTHAPATARADAVPGVSVGSGAVSGAALLWLVVAVQLFVNVDPLERAPHGRRDHAGRGRVRTAAGGAAGSRPSSTYRSWCCPTRTPPAMRRPTICATRPPFPASGARLLPPRRHGHPE